MLFITNRVLNEGPTPQNADGSYAVPRSISFDLRNNQAEQSVYLCHREAQNRYTEIGSQTFFNELKAASADQILLYIHGSTNLPEAPIFEQTQILQDLCNLKGNVRVIVIPIIWPCNNNFGLVRDYFDDQIAADASAFAFSRLFEKFLTWRDQGSTLDNPCLKRINLLAHSMGNRVLRGAVEVSARYNHPTGIPMIFRNLFMAAPDVENDTLEPGNPGGHLPESTRNLVTYYAADDLAMRASKVANMKVTSRRLGHTGPRDFAKVPRNVYGIDCGDFNNAYDDPLGHGYFSLDPEGGSGLLFDHLWQCICTGRVPVEISGERSQILNYRYWE
jgi:esterase/lipase superfamily enzyme